MNCDEHLVATYSKIRGFLHAYERGLCEWSWTSKTFERVAVLWREDDEAAFGEKRWHEGHPFFYGSEDGCPARVGVGNPLPTISFPAAYEAWRDPSTWDSHKPTDCLYDQSGAEVVLHGGSVAFSSFLGRWITIFTQREGPSSTPSSRLGEIWYAEADCPFGPWGPAVKVLSHDNYTFYNPRIHIELTSKADSFVVFAGTYTAQFANHAEPTPRYDYNQMWYRLDLDDLALQAVRQCRR
eukprot:m.23632 g.23632  ORF g.23632 m.23632 type:complete len:239 (+) comp4152_c0_seq1:908-1624(+)